MIDNISKVLGRGEKLDLLVVRRVPSLLLCCVLLLIFGG